MKDRVIPLLLLVLFMYFAGVGFAALGNPIGYKRGQLDYQSGKIEWTVIDGAVHHIEAKHE